MNSKTIIVRLILAIVIVNAAGILLRYFNLDTYIIITGFRFNLSLLFPLFLFLNSNQFHNTKNIFALPLYKKTFQPLAWIFLPLLILLAVLYLTKNITAGHPEYFYEFGLSSIVDYPIYLVWNFIQLAAFGVFLILAVSTFKHKFILTIIIILFLFAYFFVPVNKVRFDFINLLSLFLSTIIVSIIINYFQNIYWFCIVIFTIFWSNLLAFGSGSKMLIHILFAANYSGWGGFFIVNKSFSDYLLPVHLGLTVLLLAASIRNKKIIQ